MTQACCAFWMNCPPFPLRICLVGLSGILRYLEMGTLLNPISTSYVIAKKDN